MTMEEEWERDRKEYLDLEREKAFLLKHSKNIHPLVKEDLLKVIPKMIDLQWDILDRKLISAEVVQISGDKVVKVTKRTIKRVEIEKVEGFNSVFFVSAVSSKTKTLIDARRLDTLKKARKFSERHVKQRNVLHDFSIKIVKGNRVTYETETNSAERIWYFISRKDERGEFFKIIIEG